MLSNIMFYGVDDEPSAESQSTSGWYLDTRQIIIGSPELHENQLPVLS